MNGNLDIGLLCLYLLNNIVKIASKITKWTFKDIVNVSNILRFCSVCWWHDNNIPHKDIGSQFDLINKELQKVSNWFEANKLSVNASKTNVMILGTHQKTKQQQQQPPHNVNDVTNGEIILDNTKLEHVSFTKFLGVTIEENLTWKNEKEKSV